MKLEIRPLRRESTPSHFEPIHYTRCSEQEAEVFGVYIRDWRSIPDAYGQPLPRWLADMGTKADAKQLVKRLRSQAKVWACGLSLSLGSMDEEFSAWLDIHGDALGGWIGVVRLAIAMGDMLAIEEVGPSATDIDYYETVDALADWLLTFNNTLPTTQQTGAAISNILRPVIRRL